MRNLARSIMTALLLGAASPALAAPYCIESPALPRQCMYVDPANCARDAQRQGGICTANPDELKTAAGYGQYCEVLPGMAPNCGFVDRQACAVSAIQHHGACVDATPAVAPPAPDPYRELKNE